MRLSALFACVLVSPAFAAEPLAKLAPGSVPRPYGWRPVPSPDGDTLAVRVTVGFDLVNLKTGKVVTLRDDTKKRILPERTTRDGGDTALAFMPGGKTVITANHDTDVSVWDAATGKHLRDVAMPSRDNPRAIGKLDKFHYATTAVGSAAKKGVLLFGSGAHVLAADDTFTELDGFYLKGALSQWSTDGRWIGAYETQASVEHFFAVGDVRNPTKCYGEAVEYNQYIRAVRPSDDGKFMGVIYVSTVAKDNGVRLWTMAGKAVPLTGATEVFGDATAVGFSADSKRLFSTTGKVIAAWDTATGKRLPDVKLPVADGTVTFDVPRDRALVTTKDGVWAVELR